MKETNGWRIIIFTSTIDIAIACSQITSNPGPIFQPELNTETLSTPQAYFIIPTFTDQAPTVVVSLPTHLPPEQSYLLNQKRQVHDFDLLWWRNPNSQLGFDDILMIENVGQSPIRIDMFSALNDLTGSDINADNYPEVIVETFSGGAHCCFGTQVYSLRDIPVLILQKPESNAGGNFEDLNGDGILEFVTYDDSFAYKYCPYAAGVAVKSILVYDTQQDKYFPASSQFPGLYSEEISVNQERAQAAAGEFGEWSETNICAILPLILDHLYMGQPDTARIEFYNRYSGPDADHKWYEIINVVQASPLYSP